MNIRISAVLVVAALAGGVVVGSSVFGQDNKGAAGTNPEMEKMMKAWQAYSTPGEGQARLATRVGTWDVTAKQWPMPGAPVMESEGECEFTMDMGDRFLKQEYQSEFQGLPFHGFGISGHNNKTDKFQFCWIDNMGTGIMTGSGTFKGKVLSWTATATDPMTGDHTMRGTETFSDPDRFTATMYGPGPDGREYKIMELTYTRVSDVG